MSNNKRGEIWCDKLKLISTNLIYNFLMRQIHSLNLEHDNLSKQVDSIKDEAQPSKDEITRLEELTKIISEEEKEINMLTQGSKHLKEKVGYCMTYIILFDISINQNLKYCLAF